METIKVAAGSHSNKVAGAIAGLIRDNHRAEVQAIGAGAVNQAVKAIVFAIRYLRQDGIDVVFVPEFTDVSIDGNERTAIKFVIKPRAGSNSSSDHSSSSSSEELPQA